MSESTRRYLALFDVHFGWENRGGHAVPVHDPKFIDAVLSFASDFKPHHLVLGGDTWDCGSISHWNLGRNKRKQSEGLRLLSDLERGMEQLIEPLTSTLVRDEQTKTIIWGNHEDWCMQYLDEHPELEGILDLDKITGLSASGWKVVPNGQHHQLGKLYFIHGDQLLGNGMHIAKKAVEVYDRNIRFGHFHTYQGYTKVAALDAEPKTGVAVPTLSQRDPAYLGGSPNRWLQGFEYGYLNGDGTFTDYVTVATNRKFSVNGKLYRG